MHTRRSLMKAGAGAALSAVIGRARSKNFWDEQQPADWSDKDVQRLLSHSPWAKEAAAEFNMSGMGGGPPGGMGGGPQGGMGGGPPGGMGGGPQGGMGGGPPKITAIVRWESAKPIAAAEKRPELKQADRFYVISVSGLPAMGGMGAGGAGQERRPDESRIEEMQARLKEQTVLQFKGKDPIAPDRIDTGERGGMMAFLFPKLVGVTLETKEVLFKAKMGPLSLQAKFSLKDMMYQGNLEL